MIKKQLCGIDAQQLLFIEVLMYSSNQKKIVIAADALIIVFAFIGRSIAGVMIDAMPDCPFNRFSLRCPSCGGTRAMYHLFQGELKMAFEYNQFFFILTFIFICDIFYVII